MTLETLAASLDDVRADGPLGGEIASIVHDSRAVGPGALFVALRGERHDGGTFVPDAIARGASAVVLDRAHAAALLPLPAGTTALVVGDEARALSRLAAAFYGWPATGLHVVGVTGTNGKTTTVHLIAAILERAGITAGRIGTLGAHLGDAMWPLDNTTPLADELQRTLAEMRGRGALAVAMEVSSHAMALGRVADVPFHTAVLTNVTHDHLDFHGTFADYAAAKRGLFAQAERSVLSADDALGRTWAAELRAAGRPCVTFGFAADADVRADAVRSGLASAFDVGSTQFQLQLPGRFNVANALAAIAVAREFGIDDATSASALAECPTLPGRMERVRGDDIDVFVDYAHTPDALAQVLRAARETTIGRVFVVFGCGGDRDRTKRPVMGRVATDLADRTVVTSDNPRGESPSAIAAEIVAGAPAGAQIAVDLDRRSAIRDAIAAARAGDVVVIAGKGHEAYQIVGMHSSRFDDRDEARAALEARARYARS